MKPNLFACVGAKLDDVALGRRIAAKKITYGQYIKFICKGVLRILTFHFLLCPIENTLWLLVWPLQQAVNLIGVCLHKLRTGTSE